MKGTFQKQKVLLDKDAASFDGNGNDQLKDG